MATGDGRVVSNFICQALKNEPVTVYGDGKQTRSFTYLSDTIEGLVLAMRNPGVLVGPVNVGSDIEIDILTLAKLIIQLTKSDSELVFMPLPEDDPPNRKPDISLAKQKLGWEPKVELSTGLELTINYFRKELGL